jgi:hypothetical protein
MKAKFTSSSLAESIVNEKASKSVYYYPGIESDIYKNKLNLIKNGGWKRMEFGSICEYNEYGFRSPKFKKDIDLLFAGCSVASGLGLPIEETMPYILSNNLHVEYNSVARYGDSIPGQISKIFSYINEFGNPKKIVALFPDFNRFLTFNNQALLASQSFFDSYDEKTFVWANTQSENDFRTKEYMNFMIKNSTTVSAEQNPKGIYKRPLIANDVITEEISHMYAAQYIDMLSLYCKAAGIDFVWSTWDTTTNELIKKINFENYISCSPENWSVSGDLDILHDPETKNKINCHEDKNNSTSFHVALDREKGIEHSHFGHHRHLHYAETFLNYLKGVLNRDSN